MRLLFERSGFLKLPALGCLCLQASVVCRCFNSAPEFGTFCGDLRKNKLVSIETRHLQCSSVLQVLWLVESSPESRGEEYEQFCNGLAVFLGAKAFAGAVLKYDRGRLRGRHWLPGSEDRIGIPFVQNLKVQ